MKQLTIFLLTILGGLANLAHAASTDTLPKGINSPSLRIGYVQGIDQRFAGDNNLYNLGDYKSVQFTAQNLANFNQRARELIAALNRFGSQELGSNINFGVLKVDSRPEVQYYAPVYARGLTDKWTLGLGIPVVNYKNRISLSQENSNLDYYRNQLTGLSPELDAALNIDLVHETQATLTERGYRQIENRNETFIGDIQLASLYRLIGDNWNGLLYSATLSLPTGPKYNPDDLAALNIFGRTSIENKFLWSTMLSRSLEVVPYVAHQYNLPDKVTARVPKNEDDVLPDQSSKESVERRVGSSMTVGGDFNVHIDEQLSVGAGYSVMEKSRDQYSGSEGRRYDLLGQSTDSKAQRVNAMISYSTIKSFFKKKSFMPAIVAFSYQDTIAGSNVERRTINELNLMMFF